MAVVGGLKACSVSCRTKVPVVHALALDKVTGGLIRCPSIIKRKWCYESGENLCCGGRIQCLFRPKQVTSHFTLVCSEQTVQQRMGTVCLRGMYDCAR